MQVIATAGHVDHGKSTLVRALTGIEPDRLDEERRRGLTLDLGFAWTRLDGEVVAFVDVPGHERFVPTMLAGVGPVPAVVLVVAADGGWMPQSQEHLDALDALGVRRGLLVITRADLADPAPALAQARERLSRTGLRDVEAVAVSAVGGAGMDALRAALVRVVRSLPSGDPDAPVRLWVDRAFSIRGAGTVVTGTLPEGTVRVGDRLRLLPRGDDVVVRGVQSLEQAQQAVIGPARVALNLRGVAVEDVGRGDALVRPGHQVLTATADVRLVGDVEALPAECLLHVGAARVAVRLRPLDAGSSDVVRLQLAAPLPLRVGDRGLLRDPGAARVLGGVVVLDPAPPALARRRGAARERALLLATADGVPDPAGELARRGVVRRADLVALGVDPAGLPGPGDVEDGGWLVAAAVADRLRARLLEEVAAWRAADPLAGPLPVDVARQRLRLPVAGLVAALAREPLVVRGGRVVDRREEAADPLTPPVRAAVTSVLADLAAAPFVAPEAGRLRELGLGPRELAAAVRAGALVRVADGVVLAPGAVEAAARQLAGVDPITPATARAAWGTSRRVAVPLLEALDAAGVTRRLPDGGRRLERPGD